MSKKLPHIGIASVAFVLGCGVVSTASLTSLAEEGAHPPTQQEFAVRLARALGHNGGDDRASAIELLSSLSIIPGLGPAAKWQAGTPATTRFVADIQASLQLLLKRTAEDLAIPPPPTLDLFVFELPPAPQKVFFPAAEQRARQPVPAASAGAGQGASVAAHEGGVHPALPPPPIVSNPAPGPAAVPKGGGTQASDSEPPLPRPAPR